MSASGDFQTQIASIMEVLANAAVAEICKVVDDGYAVVHMEMSQSHKDNEFLRRKIKLLELQISRFRAERIKFSEGSANNRFGVRLLNRHGRETPTGPTFQSRARLVNRSSGNKAVSIQDRSTVNADHNDASDQRVVRAKTESTEGEDLDLLIVKVEGAVDDTAPGRPLEGDREHTQPATTKERDVPKATQPACNAVGRNVTEVSGSHTSAVANNQSETHIERVALQAPPTGSDRRAERPYMDLNEGNGLFQEPLAQKWTDVAANYVSSSSAYNDIIMDVEDEPIVCRQPPAASAVEQTVDLTGGHQGEVIVIDSVSSEAAGRMYDNSGGRGLAEQMNSFSSRAGARELTSDGITHAVHPGHFDPARTNSLQLGYSGQGAPTFPASERSLSSTGGTASSSGAARNAVNHQRALPDGHFSQSPLAPPAHSSHVPAQLKGVAAVQRPFACGFCRKRFVLEVDLRKHCLNHNRQKQFSCSVCHKGFISASQLKVHQYVHTGERPFGCKECGRTFSHPSNLRRHQKLQHN